MASPLLPRQTASTGDTFLGLISNPFQSQLQVNSIYASIIWSFAVSGLLFILFVLLRPRNSTVYAPRAKHADQKHAPAALPESAFAWTRAVRKIEENELVDKIGLDAVIFLRFARMLRNVLATFAVFGCAVLIPLNLVGGHSLYSEWPSVATLMKFTPQYIFGQKFWGYVFLAYFFQITLFSFIWWNYRAVLRLRRRYFDSEDYRLSLHSRTLLVTQIPRKHRSDEGLSDIVRSAKSTDDYPRVAIARTVKDLPILIKQHDAAVRKLEGYLAKYLANPDKLPASRPMCKIAKDDRRDYRESRVDAIEYLQQRSQRLQLQIEEVRRSVDSRNTKSYGFASYSYIEDAHAVAYAARNKAPHGSSIQLSPRPHDLIWANLPMTSATRRTRNFWFSLWMVVLTIAYMPFNILSAVFLSDFAHLGLLWPAFQTNLNAHPRAWGIAQGILAPTFQYLIFLGLPVVFRRLYNHAGDISKTSRERHVIARLYGFFVFNNLIVYSIFGSAFKFVASVIEAQDQGVWDALKNAHIFTNLMSGLCNVSTFWLTYQMQQNLSAAIDISQLLPLITSWYKRKFSHPTPREMIEMSAPRPFDYASYYNNYLFVSTVGMCFGILQPIIFPITAFYLFIEVMFKRYMLQYISITKTESGGLFWRTLINRVLVANTISNAVVALIVGAQGIGAYDLIAETAANAAMLYALVPLPIFTLLFKWYCSSRFDDKLRYFTTTARSDLENFDGTQLNKSRKGDRVAVRFGHPALYRTLITPMVDAKAEHVLKEILSAHMHKGAHDAPTASSMFGYSDLFLGEPSEEKNHQDEIDPHQPFEFVAEENMDFENFKRRAEFRDEFGGDGELYGTPEDLVTRSATPSTFQTLTADSPIPLREIRRRPISSVYEPLTFSEMEETDAHDVQEDQPTPGYLEGNDDLQGPHVPFIGRDRAGSVDVDLPGPLLGKEDILAAGDLPKR